MSTQLHLRHIYTRWAAESVTVKKFTLNWILVTPISEIDLMEQFRMHGVQRHASWNTFCNETGLYF